MSAGADAAATNVMKHLLAALFLVSAAHADNPFRVTPQLGSDSTLRVAFVVPPGLHLYADKLEFEIDGHPTPFTLPAPVEWGDKRAYGQDFTATYQFTTRPATLIVRYQGCDNASCYFPQTETFTFDGPALAADAGAPAAGDWRATADKFSVSARGSGYLNERAFLTFLTQSEAAPIPAATAHWGVLVTVGLVVLGGIGLNLTPCVLPLIPINLAIIGAGTQAGSKRCGFALGGTYAAGMAVAYGVLGAVVVLTGSKFGTLNSSPWFNLAIAAIFIVLALAMFDVFTIDLSRFQGRAPANTAPKSKYVMAYTMGSVAALLAGACVAPVVISVLLQASALYNRGLVIGLVLPLLLGVGMGLPWPFAGAGLSFLPKPGVWMTRVKYAFGIMIALFSLYYATLAGRAFIAARQTVTNDAPQQLLAALQQAEREGKPVFVDFWASWCKNCSAMEHTTFRAPAVQHQLGNYIQVKLQAERPNDPATKELLDYFGALGLPTYVVLAPPAVSKPLTQLEQSGKL